MSDNERKAGKPGGYEPQPNPQEQDRPEEKEQGPALRERLKCAARNEKRKGKEGYAQQQCGEIAQRHPPTGITDCSGFRLPGRQEHIKQETAENQPQAVVPVRKQHGCRRRRTTGKTAAEVEVLVVIKPVFGSKILRQLPFSPSEKYRVVILQELL